MQAQRLVFPVIIIHIIRKRPWIPKALLVLQIRPGHPGKAGPHERGRWRDGCHAVFEKLRIRVLLFHIGGEPNLGY